MYYIIKKIFCQVLKKFFFKWLTKRIFCGIIEVHKRTTEGDFIQESNIQKLKDMYFVLSKYNDDVLNNFIIIFSILDIKENISLDNKITLFIDLNNIFKDKVVINGNYYIINNSIDLDNILDFYNRNKDLLMEKNNEIKEKAYL